MIFVLIFIVGQSWDQKLKYLNQILIYFCILAYLGYFFCTQYSPISHLKAYD